MNENVKKRLMRTAILCLVALFIGAGLGAMQIQREMNKTAPKEKPMAGVKIGGPFALLDQDGKMVTNAAFIGKYKLIYFGFTSCPAICPTELAKMSKALNELGAQGDVIQPIFITVDPERDTPKVMKDYISLFHPRLIGLTGAKSEIDQTLKNYRIYAAKQPEEGGGYTMNHSNYIYFMSPDDELLSIYHEDDSAEFIAQELRLKAVPLPPS